MARHAKTSLLGVIGTMAAHAEGICEQPDQPRPTAAGKQVFGVAPADCRSSRRRDFLLQEISFRDVAAQPQAAIPLVLLGPGGDYVEAIWPEQL